MQFFLRIIYYIFSLFPGFLLYGVAKVLGYVLLYIVRFRKKIVLFNLNLVYGSNGWDKSLLREIYFHFALTALELLQQPVFTTPKLLKRVSCIGADNYQEAVNKGKGILVLTGHYANWERCIVKIAEFNNPVNVVVKDVKGFDKNYFTKTFRESHKINCIEKDGKVLLTIFKALKRGETVCMVMDQNAKRTEGCFVNFMGHLCSTFASPMFIAAKTGATVLPGTAHRDSGDPTSQTIQFHDPIEVAKSEVDEESIQRNTQKVMDVLSQALYDHPAYWIWMHKRWKTRPDSEKENGLKVDYSATEPVTPK